MNLAALRGRCALAWDDRHALGRPVTLHCYRASGHAPDRPVVLVQHGMGRNGDEYRDAWIETADRHGLLIVAPTFSDAAWPGSQLYNDGHVRAEDGSVRPREAWSNAIPMRVFATLRAAGVTSVPRPHLWGHSAGGQFVHRLASLHDPAAFAAIGAANAGWYTLPTLDAPYPEGLGGIGLDEAALRRLLTTPLTIFAGDHDVEAHNLPSGPAAMAQGPTRFARAQHYLAAGQEAAARRGVACAWSLIVVPGVGHEGMRMAGIAGAYWFDGALPAPAEPGRAVRIEA